MTRATRSMSDERSMPIAWLARGPNSSIIRPVPVPMSTSRPSGCLPTLVDRLLNFALGDVERSDLVPDLGMPGEITVGGLGSLGTDDSCAQHPRQTGTVSPHPPICRPVRTAARPVRLGERENTQLPSLRRSSTFASARILRWRETRGWLCPRTWASSPTDSSISRSSATIAAGWGRQAPEIGRPKASSASRYKDIKISLYGQFSLLK